MQKSENEKFALDKGEASLLPSSSAPEGIPGNRGVLKGRESGSLGPQSGVGWEARGSITGIREGIEREKGSGGAF